MMVHRSFFRLGVMIRKDASSGLLRRAGLGCAAPSILIDVVYQVEWQRWTIHLAARLGCMSTWDAWRCVALRYVTLW